MTRGATGSGVTTANRGGAPVDLALLDSDVPATAAAVFKTARLVACPVEQVLVASIGVIGVALPIEKIRNGLPIAAAALAVNQGAAASRAIMTTDPFPKEAAVQVTIGGRGAAIGGMAKGSGMIEPMMATMLAFVTTDASVPKPLLDRALTDVVNDTFNAITVDGECSTNDCVMLLANGTGGATVDDSTFEEFVAGLLVKTAIHGGDPDWGRLMAVAGRANVSFELSRAAVAIGSIVLFRDGRPFDESAPLAAEYLKRKDVEVSVDLGSGSATSTVWTCDLSADYVRINADYRP